MAWYSFNDLRSHNCLMSFVLSSRGGGKTYQSKMIGIKDYIRKGEQFMYVRRYDTELETKQLFFDDIIANGEFPDYEFLVRGYTGYIRKKVDEDEEPNEWETMMFFIPLSLQAKFKSTPFPNVWKIFFDEIIIDTENGGTYLKNEPRRLMELMSTVIRKRNGVRVFGMANNVSYWNPHFSFWGLNINPNQRFTKSKTKSVIVELWSDEGFQEEMFDTEFGQLIKGTEYGDYAVSNNTLNDNMNFIIKRPQGQSTHLATFILSGQTLTFWRIGDIMYVDNLKAPEGAKVYSITNADHEPNQASIVEARNKFNLRIIKTNLHANTYYTHSPESYQLTLLLKKYI